MTLTAFHSAQNSGNFGQKSNRTQHFGSVQPGITTMANPLILISQTKCPFPFDNFLCLSPVPLFGIPHTKTITRCAVAWVWLCNQNVPFHWGDGISKISNWIFRGMERAPCDHAKNQNLAMVKGIQNKSFVIFQLQVFFVVCFCYQPPASA